MYIFMSQGLPLETLLPATILNMHIRSEQAPVRVIALDWDGTVVDSIAGKLAQNQAIAKNFNRDMTLDEVRGHWNTSAGFEDLMYRLTGSTDMDTVMAVVRRDYGRPEYAKRLFDFSESALRRIHELGKRAALITSVTREILEIDVADMGLSPLHAYFDFTQTADENAFKKPDPRVFARMIEALQVPVEATVYVGDEMKDFEAATSAGLQFIGVETGMASQRDFANAGAISVASLMHVLDIIAQDN